MTADVVIRKATADDLPACAHVINTWMDETDVVPRIYSHQKIRDMFSPDILNNRTMWVVILEGTIEGYLSLIDGGNIRGFYLSRALRGRGVAHKLMAVAKASHPAFLELGVFETNARARRFYEREGFVEVPEKRDDQTEEGVPVLFMRWPGAKTVAEIVAKTAEEAMKDAGSEIGEHNEKAVS
ncbi:MAG: GNAT family N-acetyltransferase [Pseudomonadota bacterium]